MDAIHKLRILSAAAKYDASCSSSGSARPTIAGGIGNGAVGGICHSWAADGRCVSLLKVLLSNACAYDCAYCINRRSNDIARTGFEPDELVRLVIDFYKRNYIEGLFLSSGVVGCPDATMERMIGVAKTLRTRERWNGYLHLKAIPGASSELVCEAARWADRVSVNIELPTAASLERVAPDKKPAAIFGVMRTLARASGFEPRRMAIAPTMSSPADQVPLTLPATRGAEAPVSRPMVSGNEAEIARPSVMAARADRYRNPSSAVLPAGQTTQLVVGASPESDATILTLAENLYLAYDVRRVYYSAFVPAGQDPRVPALPGPPLIREHRLYQADWLFRFYGFRADEILDAAHPFLDTDLDPKSSWALRNLDLFPIEVNTADYIQLLRVPGIGPRSASRIVRARTQARLTAESLGRLGVVMKRASFFVTCSGISPRLPAWSRPSAPDASWARAALIDGAATLLAPRQLEFNWDAEHD
ncbi:MAG TPA: putative DNA modification/repair radical SAM protein [bacterium]|nr:putative DNA modification/repair radical SAM protein [bacterium]